MLLRRVRVFNAPRRLLFKQPAQNYSSLSRITCGQRAESGRRYAMAGTSAALITAGYFLHGDEYQTWLGKPLYALTSSSNDQNQIRSLCRRFVRSAGSKSSDLVTTLNQMDRTGIDWNLQHPFGWTLLHVACANRLENVVEFLLKKGVNVNALETWPSDLRNNRQLFTEFYESRRDELTDEIQTFTNTQGFAPLHYAVLFDQVEIVRMLLNHGADPSLRTAGGYQAKHLINRYSDDKETMKNLLDAAEKKYLEQQKQREKELRRKYPLEQKLRDVIVGQDDPINSVASAIRRKENGWHDEGRPLVFLFLGSSGIGKTELAKQLAKYIHKEDPEGFIRIDMSEFQSKHEVSKFIGSPPGYVGFEEGGQLTKRLQQKPNAVVLLDEVEKAHIDVLTIMLQVFDEGRLTDGKGATVDCRDAIFIMTSNLAQEEIAQESGPLRDFIAKQGREAGLNDESTSAVKRFLNTSVYPILRQHFRRDEFLGRINEVLLFLPFTEDELHRITEKELEYWARRAKNQHQITLRWTSDAIQLLSQGYNVRYGARSIKHEVEKRVVNQIAKAHELDHIREGSVIHVYADGSEIRLRFENNGPSNGGSGLLSSLFRGNSATSDPQRCSGSCR